MAKLQIAREVLDRARDRSNLTDSEKSAVDRLVGERGGKGSVAAPVTDYPLAFLKALLDDSRLTANQRAAVSMHVFGMSGAAVDRDSIYHTAVASPVEFGSTFVALGGKSANCEYFLNGRWYPVTLGIQFIQDKDQVKGVLIQGCFSLCECSYGISRYVYPDLFLDESGQPVERTVLDVLHQFGFRRLQAAASEFNLKLVRAESAKLTLVGGTVEELAQTDINGRQIRNLTRLARILYPDGHFSLEQMRGVLSYGCS